MAPLAPIPALLLALRLILALILYGFLGLAFLVLWRSLQQGQVENAPAPTPAMLIVEEDYEETVAPSPSNGEALPPTTADAVADTKSSPVPLRLVTAIGRADDNVLVLEDPFASAHHALILWREGQWYLEDLDSHNGTQLNGKTITTPHPLVPGDRIGIGQTILRFESNAHAL
jgi:hypothetical protein